MFGEKGCLGRWLWEEKGGAKADHQGYMGEGGMSHMVFFLGRR